jgi:hypothetical protein
MIYAKEVNLKALQNHLSILIWVKGTHFMVHLEQDLLYREERKIIYLKSRLCKEY